MEIKNYQNTKYKPLQYWPGKRDKNLSFVLLKHSGGSRGLHYDLLLELDLNGNSEERLLWGFECDKTPNSKARCLTWHTHGMHRKKYLFFEGNIGKGRGKVKCIDKGIYNIKRKKSVFILSIQGKLLRNHFMLLHHRRGIHIWQLL